MTTPAASTAPAAAELDAVFPGDSEMAGRCRALDWAATPLGPVDDWPPSLRTVVGLCLAAPGPMCLSWGPELALVYNDGYRAVLGAAKHPGALGRPTRAAWAEIWDQVAPELAQVMAGGPVTAHEDQRLVLRRGGRDEETFFSYAFVPVRDEAGRVGGVLHVFVETTGRVRAEAALGAERERLRAVILSAPAPMALHLGPAHTYALVNGAYRRISGGGRDVTGLAVRDAFPELAGQGIFEAIDRVYATGEGWGAPEVPIRYDRHGRGPEDTWYNLRLEPVRGADGGVEGVVNFSFEITEQVRARQAVEGLLAESEAARAEVAATNAQLQDQQLELELANHQLQENAAELEAQAEELTAAAAQLEEQAEAAARARGEADAERARVVGILAANPAAAFVLDARGRAEFVNAAFGRLVGADAAALVGADFWAAFPGARETRFYAEYARIQAESAAAGGAARTVALEDYYPPLAAWYDIRAVAEGGRLLVFFTDATARHAAAAERERLLAESEAARAEAEQERERAVEANAGKSQFLANMSHELRTPLNAIAGYTQLLELGIHGPVSDPQREALGRVQAAQRRLLALINDVLNYAKLEGGRVEYDMAAVDLRDVVADVAPLVEPQLAAKGLAFDVRLPDAPCLVWVDRAKLGQVLVNLLSNAAKFTGAGRVTVDVATRRGAAAVAGDDAVFLRVADTGRGIPRDKQAAVFEPFVQVATGYARTGEGTGLGLAISRDLARGMGGDLRVRSAEGAGSVFTVVLRRAVSPDGTPLDRRSHEERRAEADRRDGEDRRQDAAGAPA